MNLRVIPSFNHKINSTTPQNNANHSVKFHSQPMADTVSFKAKAANIAKWNIRDNCFVVKRPSDEVINDFFARHNIRGIKPCPARSFYTDACYYLATNRNAEAICRKYLKSYQAGLNAIVKKAEPTPVGVKTFLREALTFRTKTFPFDVSHSDTYTLSVRIPKNVLFHDPFFRGMDLGVLPKTELIRLNPEFDRYILQYGLGGSEISLPDGDRFFVRLMQQGVPLDDDNDIYVVNGIAYEKLTPLK